MVAAYCAIASGRRAREPDFLWASQTEQIGRPGRQEDAIHRRNNHG